jgi:tRNA U34 2-thiouridine synthase MnmA/TrmU
VLSTDANANRVVVGTGRELETERVLVRDAVLHRPAGRVRSVRLRYRSKPVECRIGGDASPGEHDSLTLELGSPVRAAAPGQTAVLCDGDLVVGHATIA